MNLEVTLQIHNTNTCIYECDGLFVRAHVQDSIINSEQRYTLLKKHFMTPLREL